MNLLHFAKSILEMAYDNLKITLFKMKSKLSSRKVVVVPCASALRHNLYVIISYFLA